MNRQIGTPESQHRVTDYPSQEFIAKREELRNEKKLSPGSPRSRSKLQFSITQEEASKVSEVVKDSASVVEPPVSDSIPQHEEVHFLSNFLIIINFIPYRAFSRKIYHS